ncbi:MAG: AAA family ATPase [Porphyromonas sp.]|nr:AAA family ATPase [Porphyromonas sp.]
MEDYFPFTPTPTQAAVMRELEDFLAEPMEHPIFMLRGYAGTGKSSLVGAFAQMLVARGYPVRLLAPTGRAAKVLQGYCGMPAATIHRTIYRQRTMAGGTVDYEVGYNKDAPHTVYIVDEASMINNQEMGFDAFGSGRLLDDLVEYCFSIDDSCMLLVGDDAQLPPVGTTLSPAMDPSYLRGYCSRLYYGALTDIVRQEESGDIVYQSYLLRLRIQELAEGKAWSEPLLPLPRVGGEVEIISGYDLADLMESSFRRAGIEETLLVTQSNRDAEGYNRAIRYQSLYYEDEVVAGEAVMVVRNNYFYRPVDEEGKPTANFLANGELLKVLSTWGDQELYGFNFRDAELLDSNGDFVSAKILMESLYSGVASLTPEQRQFLFDNVALDYPECTSRRALYRKVRENPYLNALQIKYPYAMTCHKAQGGQWREVYISFGYLTPEMVDLSFCRWLYTAMTRATERLYLIQPPEFIYGSISKAD